MPNEFVLFKATEFGDRVKGTFKPGELFVVPTDNSKEGSLNSKLCLPHPIFCRQIPLIHPTLKTSCLKTLVLQCRANLAVEAKRSASAR